MSGRSKKRKEEDIKRCTPAAHTRSLTQNPAQMASFEERPMSIRGSIFSDELLTECETRNSERSPGVDGRRSATDTYDYWPTTGATVRRSPTQKRIPLWTAWTHADAIRRNYHAINRISASVDTLAVIALVSASGVPGTAWPVWRTLHGCVEFYIRSCANTARQGRRANNARRTRKW